MRLPEAGQVNCFKNSVRDLRNGQKTIFEYDGAKSGSCCA